MKIETPVYRCDVCDGIGTESDREEHWFTVERGDNESDVCSPDCLSRLGRQIKAGELGVELAPRGRPPKAESNGGRAHKSGGTSPNTEPCPVCGFTSNTKQGMGAHMRLGHKMKRNPEGEWAPLPTV
jgi:hypothetical protein